MRLWIDSDVGTNVDDAVALLAAVAHPDIELVGVSTTGGDVEHRAEVAAALLASVGAAVPMVAGAAPALSAVPATAPDALLAIGPLTTVAALTAVGARPACLTLMGGALRPVHHRGEVRHVEHNFAFDPPAAAAVLAVPGATMVPLDITIATRLGDADVAALVAPAPVLEPMVEAWLERWDAVVLHDPAALLVAAGEGAALGARLDRLPLAIEEDGRLRRADDAAPLHFVVTALDGRAVIARILELLGR